MRSYRIIYLIEYIIESSLSLYIVAAILFSLVLLVLGITPRILPPSNVSENELWPLSTLAQGYLPYPMTGWFTSFIILPSIIVFEVLGTKNKSLMIVLSPLRRRDIVLAGYIISAIFVLAGTIHMLISWGLINYNIIACASTSPITLGAIAALLTIAYMLPTSIMGLSLAALVSLRTRYDLRAVIGLFITYLLAIPLIATIIAGLQGGEYSQYLLAILVPGTGFTSKLVNMLNIPVEGIDLADPNVLLLLSSLSLTITTCLSIILFIRYAEVKGI